MSYDVINMNKIAKNLNNRVFTDWYYRLMLIARSVFEWENLPEGIDEKWIEKYLFQEGRCVFFKDDIKGLMVARVNGNGPLNYYDEPTTVIPYATNYQGDTLQNDVNCVIIRNNDEMIATMHTIHLYALKLTNIDRTIDVNINAQKMPLIIKCSDKQKLTLKQVIAQRNDNEPVIFGDKNLDLSGIEILNTQAPTVFKDLELEKHMILNEVYTFLGINNANMDKKERLVDDEVQANNEQVEASFNIMLKAREQACKRINEIFGTNISVRKRIDYTEILNDSEVMNDSEDSSEKKEEVM